MSTETYNEKINRNTDWGGDASTGGLPVAGGRVQEFIKDEFKGKVGAIYRPAGGNIVYCFSTEEDKQAYIAGSESATPLTTFELDSQYKVLINQDTFVMQHNIVGGTEGITLEIDFKIVDDNGISADAAANLKFTITNTETKNFESYTSQIDINPGAWTSINENLDAVLNRLKTKKDETLSGKFSVSVEIEGATTKAKLSPNVSYNIFNLKYTPSFEYNKAVTGNTISVPYEIVCNDTKYIEFYIDGEILPIRTVESVRENTTATLSISGLSAGEHRFETRAYILGEDKTTKFYTPIFSYTFAKAGEAAPSLLIFTQLSNDKDITGPLENLTIYGDQYKKISLDWALYYYLNQTVTVIFDYDGTKSEYKVTENGLIKTYSFIPMEGGEHLLKIYAKDNEDETITLFEDTINIIAEPSKAKISEATDGLILKLSAVGKTNDLDDNNTREKWEYTDADGNLYKATFNNFEWNSQQGWDEERSALSISNGATVDFNIAPMTNMRNGEEKDRGFTIEMDIESFDVENPNAVICEIKQTIGGKDTAAITLTASEAKFQTADKVAVSTQYKDNDRIHLTFIGNKKGTEDDDYFIYIVINGVLERAAMYTSSDSIYNDCMLRIGDITGESKCRLRAMRVYNRALLVDEEFGNYLIDSDDLQETYDKNDIFKEGSTTEVDFDKIANKIPVMIFTGNMKKLITEGMDKGWQPFDVEYINRQAPEYNFVAFGALLKLQGTSSLEYPRKNFKLKTKDKLMSQTAYEASDYILNSASPISNQTLLRKSTGKIVTADELNNAETIIMFNANGEVLKKGKYKFNAEAHKTDKWTLKADYMESSCSHNVGAGRSWNSIFENTKLSLSVDAGYTNNTYRDEAIVYKVDTREYYKTNEKGENVHYRVIENDDKIKAQKDFVCRTDAQKICQAGGVDDIRTAVDGFPMVCFYRENHEENNLIFIGQYNFINDKSSFEVYGFEDIESKDNDNIMIYDASNVECWEGLKNSHPLSLFHTVEGFFDVAEGSTNQGWQDTYKSRYPDPDDYGKSGKKQYDPTALYELSKWLVSTRHESDTVIDSSKTISIDDTFAKRINKYKYGYTEVSGHVISDSYIYEHGEMQDTAENRQKKFETEKWEHFDVWKVAGYYIYLMRYGAVDQFVKNTMLFTDGNGRYDTRLDKQYRKWFFINYDNDCLFGLRNNGQIAFDWTLDRNTIDGTPSSDEDGDTNTYAMMGHTSTLWNNLERDEEFMHMVRDLDDSMNGNGLNYDNMVMEFDTKQTEKWSERTYNANEKYKYLDVAKGINDSQGEEPVNNLKMLQGTRRSHRHWWISNHFNLLDAKWLSGQYKNTYVEMKTDCFAGQNIRTVAGTDYYYAWGQRKRIYESNIIAESGETVNFTFATDQVQGDPVLIYAVNKFSEMDFSDIIEKVRFGSYNFKIADKTIQNTLKKLIIGNSDPLRYNDSVGEDSTVSWSVLTNLEYLDVTNYRGIKALPLTSYPNLHTLKAFGTSLASFIPTDGSSFDLVELPSTISTIEMTNIKFKDFAANFKYTPNTNLRKLILASNNRIDNTYYNNLVKPWIESIEKSISRNDIYGNSSININNINWRFGQTGYDDLMLFKNFSQMAKKGNFNLRGKIDISSCGNLTKEQIKSIEAIFGENCFNEKKATLFIVTPDSIYLDVDKNSIVAGETFTFKREIYPSEEAIKEKSPEIAYYIVKEISESERTEKTIYDSATGKYFNPIENLSEVRAGITFDGEAIDPITGKQIGILRTEELNTGRDTDMTVLVSMKINTAADAKVSFMPFKIYNPTYVTNASISGEKSLYQSHLYKFDLAVKDGSGNAPKGSYEVEWSIDGEGASYATGTTVSGNKLQYQILVLNQPTNAAVSLNVHAKITNYSGSIVNASYAALILRDDVIFTSVSNPVAMAACYNGGFAANSDAMTMTEAANVTSLGAAFRGTGAFTFKEFAYFTGLTSIDAYAFEGSNVSDIAIPDTVRSIGKGAFANCKNLSSVTVRKTEEDGSFTYVKTLPNLVTEISEECFLGCSKLNTLALPSSVTTIYNYAFGGTSFKYTLLPSEDLRTGALILSDSLTRIYGLAFETKAWVESSPIDTTSNPLEIFSITKNLEILSRDYALFKGCNYKEFIVDEESERYSTEDGVLYDKSHLRLFRYPPKKEYVDEMEFRTINIITEYAFAKVQNLDKVIFPDTLAALSLEKHTFDSSKIKSIDLSACFAITTIPEYAFYKCTSLTELKINTQGALAKIGIYAFAYCTAIEEITIPDGVTELTALGGQSYTFYNCSKLKRLSLPHTITSLGMHYLDSCPLITNFVIPCRTSMAFAYGIVGCDGITSLTLATFTYTEKPEYTVYNTAGENVIVYDNEADAIAYCAEEGHEGYTYALTKSAQDVSVNVRPKKDGTSQYQNCGNLKEFRLSDEDNGKLYKVVDGVLYNAAITSVWDVPQGKVSVNLPSTVKVLEDHSFLNCAKIPSMVINDNVTTINGAQVFEGCISMTGITLSRNITTIPRSTFMSCSNLKEVYALGNITEIGHMAFVNDYKLQTIVILSDTAPILKSDIKDSHPFNNVGKDTKSTGKNKIYSSYGAKDSYNYDGWYTVTVNGTAHEFYSLSEANAYYESASSPKSFKINNCSWLTPLQTSNGFSVEELKLTNPSVVVTLYDDDEIYFVDNSCTATTESGAQITLIPAGADRNYNAVFNGNVTHGEDCTVTIGGKVGVFTAQYGVSNYSVNLSAPSLGKARMLMSAANTESVNTEADTVTVSVEEYQTLVDKVNQMSEIISILLEK